MAIWHFAELYGGAALLLAALVMIKYIISRTSGADEETKSAFRPLYLVAIALGILAFGSITIYLEEYIITEGILIGTRYAYLLSFAAGVVMIGIAAVWILNDRRLYVIPIGVTLATIILMALALEIDPANLQLYEDIASLILSIVLVTVGLVFAWVAKETQRGTSASLAFALIAQIGTLPRLYEVVITDDWALLIVFFMMMGPAMVIYAFIKTEQPATFELIGYGAAFAAGILILATVSSLPVALSFVEYIIVAIAAVAAMICLGTAAFLFGRWRESKQIPTLIYMLAFGSLYLSQMIGLFGASGVVTDPILNLVDFGLMGLAFALMAGAAIHASGKVNLTLIPFLIFVPVFTVLMLGFEGSTGDLYRDNLLLMLIILVVFFLPVPIFLAVWRKMRAAGSLAAGRPLGMAMGIILYFGARLPPLLALWTGLHIGYAAVSISFFVSWMAITGRFNKKEVTVTSTE
ncbi:MAG: hypothetical protein KAR33_01095 [Candidatus Thorarchaeota archaeon]|nr:hypothetical protein [Candidatus Thorarchaeota archaeon]